MIIALIVLALLFGFSGGYMFAAARTDRTIASMSNAEIAALSERIRARRKEGE